MMENENREKKKALIIIPAYNEGATIGTLLDRLKEPDISSYADILVMNDASRDNTEEVVRSRGVKTVRHIYNLGYGSGLQLGYKYAYYHGYDYVIQMDADGQHDVSNLASIYSALTTPDEKGNYPDIILGSRFTNGFKDYPTSFVKRIAYRLFSCLIKCGTGFKVTDPTTGLQGLSKRAFSHYMKYGQFDDKYPDANMLMQMLLLGFNVREIHAVMHTRTTGESMHSGLKPIIYMFRMAVSIIAVWIRITWFKEKSESLG